jgi:hypothetical protein
MDEGGAASDASVAEADESGPLRRCIVTGESLPVERMIRFVIGPDGSVVPDLEAKLPGRGMWLSARREVVATALAKNAFARAARRPVTVAADLADRLEFMLVRRCIEFLGLARRAGQIEAGFDQVRAALTKTRRGVLVEASDGAEDGRGKLRALAPQVPMVDVLSSEELGAAFARDRFVHILLAPGRLADRLQAEAERLSGFRTASTATGQASGRQ